MPLEMDVFLDADLAECGGTVSGVVSWQGFSKAPRQIFVELVYRTEGRGDLDREVVDQVVLPGTVDGSHPYRLQVPRAGPMSYEGELIRVIWEVRARVDISLRPDPRVERPLAVLPHGGIVLWQRNRDPSALPPPQGRPMGGADDSPFEPPGLPDSPGNANGGRQDAPDDGIGETQVEET